MRFIDLKLEPADLDTLQSAQITYEARLNLINHFQGNIPADLQDKLLSRYEDAFAHYELAKQYIIDKYQPEPNPLSFNAVFGTGVITFEYDN